MRLYVSAHWQMGASWSMLWSHSGCVCLTLGFSLSAVRLFHIRCHGCFGLSSFIKGSTVSESLWCFLSRGGSTLLQRVQEGERIYPPLGSTGWWEPRNKKHTTTCYQQESKLLADINTDAVFLCNKETDTREWLCTPVMLYVKSFLHLQSSAVKMQQKKNLINASKRVFLTNKLLSLYKPVNI